MSTGKALTEAERIKRRNLWTYPVGTVGRDAIYQLFNSFILIYVIFTRNLTDAQLGVITAIMVAARIFDALNDPIMGNIIERTRTKWGKFKPWLAIGVVSTSLVVIYIFNTKLQGWAFIVAFGIVYFLYSITYTMHDISYWGMAPSLGHDANSRNQFTSRATLFAGIGNVLATVAIPMLTTGSNAIGGNAATAYGTIALIFGIAAPLFLCVTLFGVKEDYSYNAEPVPKVSFKTIINTFKGNDQLIWIAIIFLIQQIGNNVVIGGLGSTYIYFEFGYEGGYYSLFSMVGLMATGFLMVFYPMISRHINRKPLMKIMAIISLAGYAIMLLVGLLMPTSMVKFWAITIGFMLANFGMYCFYLIMMISIFNTVEYNELKHGVRDEAIITSVRPFVTKLASALTALLTSLSFLIFGVLKYTNGISDLEQLTNMGKITEVEKLAQIKTLLEQVSSGQIICLLFCITVLPCALMIISYRMYQKKYKLDEDEYDRIRAELEEIKAGKAKESHPEE
ncbi:MAG: MFS transporter [Firmicutes bacterium]|nr:MFS transporter [Bacillota bacterium]